MKKRSFWLLPAVVFVVMAFGFFCSLFAAYTMLILYGPVLGPP